MFDEAYTKLELDETAIILESINTQIEGSLFDPLETTILSIDVPFYQDVRFLDIADHATKPPLQRYAFNKKETQNYTLIDWTYKTIYTYNAEHGIYLTPQNVIEYVRFFFTFVKGRHGRFVICESAENIRWKDEPPEDIRKSINMVVTPLKIIEQKSDGIYKISGCMMLKDAMFKVDVFVHPNGKITMANHEILIEDVPILDPIIGS